MIAGHDDAVAHRLLSELYAMISMGRFPQPIHLGGSGSFWVEDEIETWLSARIEAERAA